MIKGYLLGIILILTGISGFWVLVLSKDTRFKGADRLADADYFFAKFDAVISIGLYYILFSFISGTLIVCGFMAILNPNTVAERLKNDNTPSMYTTLKYPANLLRQPINNSKVLTKLDEGDTVLKLPINSNHTSSNFQLIFLFEWDKDIQKGWVSKNALNEKNDDSILSDLTYTIGWFIKPEFIKKGIIEGFIGFLIAYILSFFTYSVRNNLLYISYVFSAIIMGIDYSLFGIGIVIMWLITPQILIALLTDKILLVLKNKLFL